MGVSDRDRDVLRRIGAAKEASHRDAHARHVALPLEERLRRSWALYRRMRSRVAPPPDDPSPFYERARALGLEET